MNAWLVYQCGIANVFTDSGGQLQLVLQNDYIHCEMFIFGLQHAGVPIWVGHCDLAGDILSAKFIEGVGNLWPEKKFPPAVRLNKTKHPWHIAKANISFLNFQKGEKYND